MPLPPRPPTPRQRAIYEYIRLHIAAESCAPTYREICEHFGIRSPNGVKCHLDALHKKGLIDRRPLKSRGLRIAVPGQRCDLLDAMGLAVVGVVR